jgi:hypothetical protein
MSVSASSLVPSGVYTIRVGEQLYDGTSCSFIPTSSCAGVFTLTVYQAGATLSANLQDAVNLADANVPSTATSLSDVVQLTDTYVAPAVAQLSDAVNVIDRYVAPVTAPLSDAIHLVDTYVSPVTAPLSDAVSVADHIATSIPPFASAAGLGVLVAAWGVFAVRKRSQKRKSQGEDKAA